MKKAANHSTIEDVRKQFQVWRATRRNRREPIPDHLWNAAIQLCSIHCVSSVCKALKLCYTDLKNRLNLPKPYSCDPDKPPVFHQVDAGALFAPQHQWQMVCQRADGAVLNLSASGAYPPPVTDILKGFLP